MDGVKAEIVSINISAGGIPKHPVPHAGLTVKGLEGDGHHHEKHYRIEQAVCIRDWKCCID